MSNGGGYVGVNVEALNRAAVPEAARFLNSHLNDRVSSETWAAALDTPWATPQPNHGFILREDDTVVGVLLAFYSEREIAGRSESFCNLGAWCVLPDYRFQSLRLLRTALAQDGYTFTDLSPSGPVIPLNTRLGFTSLDTTTFVVPCLPRLPLGSTKVLTEIADIRPSLTADERRIFDDHQWAPAVHHVVMQRREGHCYVLYRRDRRKGLPLFATVLYASNRTVFARGAGALAGQVGVRHRVVALLVEDRVADRPAHAVELRRARPKMFRSQTVKAEEVDNLYSELCCVPW